MKRWAVPVTLLVVLWMNASESLAQSPVKLAVHVVHAGGDAVGQNIAYAVREELRRSVAYSVSTANDSAVQIRLVSLDLALPRETEGHSSAIAVTYTVTNYLPLDKKDPQTWLPIYPNSQLLLVGRSQVETQAKSVVSLPDREIEDYRSQLGR